MDLLLAVKHYPCGHPKEGLKEDTLVSYFGYTAPFADFRGVSIRSAPNGQMLFLVAPAWMTQRFIVFWYSTAA